MTTNAIPNGYPIPPKERERIAALHSYEILDSAREPVFDRVAILAARLFRAPIALVSFIDGDRQWFKAKHGLNLDQTEVPREFSFCTHAMLEQSPLVICDATQDARFRHNPFVTGESAFRFYVGAPLVSQQGIPLGALCVFDTVVRERPEQYLLDCLMDLAFVVSEQLEFRAALVRSEAQRRNQEQLEHARKTAEAANRAKSDFLARMSHEIRTPMNLINGMNALLLESPLNEKQRQLIEISYRNVRRLLRLINGILDLSKVEAGQLTLQAVPFNLSELLKECAATISAAIERKGLELEIGVDPGVWQYWLGDPERLQQVLLNLVGNSIKFTEKGKIAVRVVAELDSQGKIGLRFEVSDSGCGVPADKSAVIFEAFQQADESMIRPYEGTGLGLAIAKNLVERMSGKIWLEQGTGPGATFAFTVFLPRSTESAVRQLSESTLALKSRPLTKLSRGLRILLAEDNFESVILVRAYLESLLLSIDVVANGSDAVEKRKQNSYDLVLMDLQMPVMDGYTATREIRRWEKAHGMARVPIVALTAHALSGAAAESAEAGCDGHLSKPMERRDLIETIAKFAYAEETVKSDNGAVPDLIAERRPAFLASRRNDLEKMRSALAASDFVSIQRIGHNCKGIGTGYGFPEVSAIGLAIESAAKEKETHKLEESLGDLERCLAAASGGRP